MVLKRAITDENFDAGDPGDGRFYASNDLVETEPTGTFTQGY